MNNTDGRFSLPSPLEDSSLMTIQVAPDGSYTDKDGVVYKGEDGMRQKVARRTIELVRSMSIGQKLIIVEEQDTKQHGEQSEREQYEMTGPLSFADDVQPSIPAVLPTQSHTISLVSTFDLSVVADEENLSAKPRCDRCREGKKRCNKSRSCQHCKEAGIGVEDCVSERYGTIWSARPYPMILSAYMVLVLSN